MKAIIGIGREEKNIWERRVPLIPVHVGELIRDQQLDIRVQTSPNRIFPDGDFRREGAKIVDDLSSCSLILAIKEIPIPHLERGKAYVFFTHTTKASPQHAPA
jgi:alpha-aminoadipic semialdehyde synthase